MNRRNNFDLLRLLAAGGVMAQHLADLSAQPSLSGLLAIGARTALPVFFIISGHLVVMSYENSSSLADYAAKRLRRIVPAYMAVVVLCALAGAWFTTLSLRDYFGPGWWRYLAANLSFMNFAHPDLPGVFLNNPFPKAPVNGSLWTIKVELMFYAVVPGIVALRRRLGHHLVLGALFVLGCAWWTCFTILAARTGHAAFAELAKQLPGQLMYFMPGAWAWYERDRLKRWGWKIAIPAAACFALTVGCDPDLPSLPVFIYPLALSVGVMWLAYQGPYVGNATRHGDLSYGVYLTHFPVIQALVSVGLFHAQPWLGVTASLVITLALAWISWHFIEAPALHLGQRPAASPARSSMVEPHSLLGLELVRVACTVSVLVWHYQHFYVVGHAFQGLQMQAQPLYHWLQPFYQAGWLGVEVFWTVSGFIFFWKYAEAIHMHRVSAWRFACLRFSRLYPLHLVTLCVVAALAAWYRSAHGVDYVYLYNDAWHFFLQLFMVSDWGGRNEWSFNGPIWSVSIEILVYGLFFMLCRLGWTHWWQALIMVALAGLLYGSRCTDHPLVLCVFFFYLGALSCHAHRTLTQLSSGWQTLSAAALAAMIAAVTILLLRAQLRPMYWVALAAPMGLLLSLRYVQPRSQEIATTLARLGQATYACYLLHFPLQLLVANLTDGQPQRLPLDSPWWLIGYITLTFIAGLSVYRYFEMPMQSSLRRRLLPRFA